MSYETKGYTIQQFFLSQTRAANLDTNTAEFMGWGFAGPNGTEANRQAVIPFNCTLTRYVMVTADGNHDEAITLTNNVEGIATALVITIPASGGAATLSVDANVSVLENQKLSIEITVAGAGAGTTTDNTDALRIIS